MRLHSFQELVTRINNLSTRNKKPIRTTWSGTEAYTNLETVNLPALPAGTILSESQFCIWLGYDIHEGPGHQVHTDLELYIYTCKQRNNPQFSYILNLLEDIRIENADIAVYPGDRKYLDAVHTFVDQKIPNHLSRNPDIMGLIYKHLYVYHRNLDTNIIHGTLDQTTAQLISEIDQCISTQDCINLADKVINYLNQKQEEQNQPQPNQNQGDKNETSNSSNNSEPEKSNEEASNEANTNGNSDGLGNGTENENEVKSQTGNGNQSKTKDETPTSFNFSDQSTEGWQEITEIKNIIKYLKDQIETKYEPKSDPDKDLKNKSIFPPVNIQNDRIYAPSLENINQYNQARAECSSQILALKKMFRIYLQAQTRKATIRGLDEGHLDTQRLHIIATGSTTIFKDQSQKLLPETAIELMIDMSGSMDAETARTAAIILSEALNSIPQIKLSISGFTTNNKISDNYHDYDLNLGRKNGMDILQFKNFNEPYAKCRAKLGAITNSGFTPLGDAYGHALEHIINRPETRKIIFLITDGMPEFYHGENHSDFLLMKKIHSTTKRFNIQTLGLGIGRDTQFLNKYFDKSISITEIENLPKNLLEALKFFI